MKEIKLTGLENLVNTASLNETNPFNTKFISINKLEEHEFNDGRQTKENVGLIKQSIIDAGLLQPLLVYKLQNGNYKIISGHGRYRAIKELKEYKFNGTTYDSDEIPVIIDREEKQDDDYKLNILRSNAQKDETVDDKVLNVKKAEELYLKLRSEDKITIDDHTTKRRWISEITGYSESSVKLYLNKILNKTSKNKNIVDDDFEKENFKKINKYLRKVDELLQESLTDDSVNLYSESLEEIKNNLKNIINQLKTYE